MEHKLPDLPWPKDALAPVISAETIEFHHGKHHQTYVTKLNELISGTPFSEKPLEEIVRTSEAGSGIYNNACQHWNHTFYWQCLTPSGKGRPEGELAEAIERDFGGFDAFKEQFTTKATTLFGSGWTWLVEEDGRLSIVNTANADTPAREGLNALIVTDVWEHAYYIDYRNARPKFVEGFWKLADWEFAALRLRQPSDAVLAGVKR